MATVSQSTRRTGPFVLGVVLIIVGLLAWLLQQSAIDVDRWLGGSGWTLFVIVPGILLLIAAVATSAGAAQGFTTAGFIVTSIGLLLLYQARTGHWESWSYAWSVIPAAAGLSLIVHGLRTRARDLVATGATMLSVAAALFVAGAWYFETVFRTGRIPFDLAATSPIALIAIGVVVVVVALLRGTREEAPGRGIE